MRKEDIPAPSASTSVDCQQFIHKYGLKQWRNTDYLVVIDELMNDGFLPTDVEVARRLDDKRTKHSVRSTLEKLVEAGLLREGKETARGFSYSFTDRGEVALVEVNQILATWEKMHEDKIDAPAPDYSATFANLNRTIKAQEIALTNVQYYAGDLETQINAANRENHELHMELQRLTEGR